MSLDATPIRTEIACDSEPLSEIEKLSQDLGDAYEQLTLIYRTVRHLGASFRLETIAAQLIEHAREAAPADSAALYLADAADGTVRFSVASRDGAELEFAQTSIDRFGSLKRPTFWSGDSARALFPNRTEPSSRRPTDVLASPLDAGGRTLGFLILARSSGERFTTVESKLIGALCNVTAVAVANWQHYRAIQNEREMLEGVIREIGDGIVIAGADGIARHTNPAARGFLQVDGEGYDVAAAMRAFKTDREFSSLASIPSGDVEFRAESRDARRPLVLACRAFRASFGAAAEPILVLRLRDATREHHEAEAQRDFMSLASHKLRTPLTKILGLLPLVADESVPTDLKAEGASGIERGATELSHLVDGILEFIDFRRGGHAIETLDLAATVRSAIDRVVASRANAARVEFTVEPSLPAIAGSRHLIETLAGNLVDNALKFSPPNRPVEVALSRRGDAVRITVTDHGEGIAPELVSRLFSPFSQRDLGFTGQDEGAGLGLLLAREAALRHGGSIEVDSELGRGSTFAVDLPLAGASPSPP